MCLKVDATYLYQAFVTILNTLDIELEYTKWIRLLDKNYLAPSSNLLLNKIKNLKKRYIFLI